MSLIAALNKMLYWILHFLIILSVFMLNGIMLSGIMLGVLAPKFARVPQSKWKVEGNLSKAKSSVQLTS